MAKLNSLVILFVVLVLTRLTLSRKSSTDETSRRLRTPLHALHHEDVSTKLAPFKPRHEEKINLIPESLAKLVEKRLDSTSSSGRKSVSGSISEVITERLGNAVLERKASRKQKPSTLSGKFQKASPTRINNEKVLDNNLRADGFHTVLSKRRSKLY